MRIRDILLKLGAKLIHKLPPVRLSFQNICFSLKRTFADGNSNVS